MGLGDPKSISPLTCRPCHLLSVLLSVPATPTISFETAPLHWVSRTSQKSKALRLLTDFSDLPLPSGAAPKGNRGEDGMELTMMGEWRL